MEQHGGALFIVNRNVEEFRVERNYLERKVSRGVSIAMTDVSVPPVVRAAENRQVFEDESFAIKALLFQQCDCILNFFALIRLQTVGANQKRSVPNYQDHRCGAQYPRHALEKASFLWGRAGYRFCR
jgi:hypothetical protein